MISVLTMTYQRHELLEEAMESFLRQDFYSKAEMVIINDSNYVEYIYNNPTIRLINCTNRFPSIGEKLFYGVNQCKYDYIYRLDDDDLLAPWALDYVWEDIQSHPDYDIYRSNGHYLFENNDYKGISSNVNNGNVYRKDYLRKLTIPKSNFGEDSVITFQSGGNIYESNREYKTMLYRWGMNTFHLSGMGKIDNELSLKWTDKIVSEKDINNAMPDQGKLFLQPHFKNDYYKYLNT